MNITPWDALPPQLTWKEKIAYLGVVLSELGPGPALTVKHVIGNGMYIREMTIPAGTIFLGREHLKGHEVHLLKGSAILILPDGSKVRKNAVTSMHTQAGFHTVAYTLTEVQVHTVHPNRRNLEDTQALEDEIFGPASELLELGLQVQSRLRLAA